MLDRKLKICLICDTRSIHYQRWIRDLKRQGHELYIFSPFRETIDQENVEFVPTPKAPFPLFKSVKTILKMLYRVKLAFDIRKKLKVIKPDLVHAHFLTDSGWIGAWVNYHPFVVTAHGSDVLVHPVKSKIYRFVVVHVLKKADKVIIVAQHLKDNLVKFGGRAEKIVTIPNYINPKFFTTESKIDGKFRNFASSPTIVSARKLEPIYNVETLIKAAPIVANKFPQCKFYIIGDGEKYDLLKSMVDELNLTENFLFTGKLNHDELAEYFKQSHIYVSTALSDGLAVTTIEGMAGGMVPVLTNIPANSALVYHQKNGFLFECENENQLGESILQAIIDTTLTLDACKKNLKFVVENFSSQVVIEKTEQEYANLIYGK